MLQQGEPFEVLSHPRNETVARQMGLRNIFHAEVSGRDEEANITWLKMGEQIIASDSAPELAIGQQVRWVIPNQGIRFNAISSGRLCRSINKLDIVIDSILVMGESVRVKASMRDVKETFNMDVPSHLATKLNLKPGLETTIALKSEQVHILES